MKETESDKIISESDELRRSKDILRLLIDSLPDPTIMIDMNCRVLLANKAVEKLCGKDPVAEHLYCYQAIRNLQAPCAEIYPGSCPCGLAKVISTKAVERVTQTWFNGSKDPVYMDIICAPIVNESGEVIMAVESYRDVSRYKQELEESQKLVLNLREALATYRKD